MNILILGYGKMGQLIAQLSEERGHSIAAKINIDNRNELENLDPKDIDVAIEFSQPEAAVANIRWAIERGIPVVSGTTGWLDQKPSIEQLTLSKNGAFFYASNYSIGVNIFFKVNEFLSKLMNETKGYKASVEEIHHTAKKDAPSGTAITLAEGILKNNDELKDWHLTDKESDSDQSLPITSKRIDPAPGTHIIRYQSEIDDIEISHTAHSRQGFALGSILVAEWIQGKKGVLSMDDYLSF
ncbi:4-hydroxy-tetrahydrodipicolinate reductase [Algoriphagus halophytocola]|uniref:4-hydroxy-tetrahydrodipicolinate reductase n=1 Tax=Algoriphagus halophytocola TaxID=2991499 RepID=A0ABY6MF35_9BACT|nr:MULTISPECIES: 4-hydroxy-tetrahydrodipicolinate reductase [unclassified Algoriphagus]UZD22433.1 4-hydroxy-tetrahydrodipicolinate reductase [Algoriphagus sp. TR-M5]WBL43693.1 4-hydroxy-tetrahydrodipicolinate reductase [Algoriphagus sp. TR-M9]